MKQVCPSCNRSVEVRTDGFFCDHTTTGRMEADICVGSGIQPFSHHLADKFCNRRDHHESHQWFRFGYWTCPGSYEYHKTAIFKALTLGIMADELPDWEREQVERIAGWLASEGIGTLR